MEATTTEVERTEAFADRLVGVLNDAALALMVSIGHRTGLFDSMKGLPPATSGHIAAAAGLDERYVREWLGALVTGGIVEHDERLGTYHLPTEHAACLTRAAGSDNLAVPMQWIAVLGGVEDRIADCFRTGGGVPYEAYARFHEVMAEDSAQTVLPALEDSILPLVPGLAERLERGIDVLDVGCGRGRAACALAKRFPRSRFTGVDLAREAIESGRAEAERLGLANVELEARDAARLGMRDRFDLVTAFDAIHDQVDPAAVLAGIRAALREVGVFLMQDIRASSHVHRNLDHPVGPFLYTVSTMHCMSVSLAGGGAGLGTCWGEERALQMLADAGFPSVRVHTLPHDVMNSYYVARKRKD